MFNPLAVATQVAGPIDGPEAVAWDPKGYLYAGGQSGLLHRFEVSTGRLETVADLGGRVLGLLVTADRSVLACNQDRRCVQRIDLRDYSLSVLFEGTAGLPMTTPNYLVASSDGTLYVSDSGIWGHNDGRIYTWTEAEGAALLVTDSRAYPNGLAIDPDGRWLWVIESSLPGVVRYSLSGESTREVVWLAPKNSVPDGIAFCADGSAIVAFYEPNRVARLRDGVAEDVALDPTGNVLTNPTNVAFFGDDLERLCAANLGGQYLVELDVGLIGAPVLAPLVTTVAA